MREAWKKATCLLWFFLGMFADSREGWKERRRKAKRLGQALAELLNEYVLTRFRRMARISNLLECLCVTLDCLIRYSGLGFLIGWSLEHANPDSTPPPRSAYSEGISLFGLIITNGIALTLSQLHAAASPSWWLLGTYFAISLTVVIGLVMILRAGLANESQPARHVFERGSIMFIRTILAGSIIVSGSFAFLAWTGQLPGQAFVFEKEAELGYPQSYSFNDKTCGVMVPINLSRKQFEKGVPPKLNLEITISAEVAKSWELEGSVKGFIEEGGKDKELNPGPAALPPSENKMTVLLDNLKSDARYVFQVYLHGKRNPTAAEMSSVIATISANKGMKAVFLSRDKN